MKRKINILRSFQTFCITFVLCFLLCFICNERKTNNLFSYFSDNSNGFRYTNKSFVFSLRNSEGLGPFKSYVTNPSKAIYSGRSGIAFGGKDIYIRSDSRTSAVLGPVYYVPSGVSNVQTVMAGEVFFYPDDWEVFYLA